jgi:hypothetical protein
MAATIFAFMPTSQWSDQTKLLPRSRDYNRLVHSPGEMIEERCESARGSAASVSACDLCGSARSPRERQRIVWNSGGVGAELVLADLCSTCAADPERVLDRFGGHARGALRVSRETRVEPSRDARMPRFGRVLVYLLVAFASFIIVTLISSLR